MDYSKLSDQELRAILAQSSSDLAPASRDYSSMSDEELLALIQGGSAETPKTGRGGVLPSLAEGFVTSFTDIPLGIASIFSEAPEETAAGKFSTQAEKTVQNILGIDPTKEATTAESVAGGLGSLASFLVPGTIAAKGAKALGAGAAAVRGAGMVAAGAQAVPLGGAEQVQRRMAEEAATGVQTSGEDRLASQRLGAAIGLSELVPLRRFIGPLEEILTKIPLSKAGAAGKVVKRGVTRALGAATEEGAQEALAQTAQNLVEQGYYNPDLDITEGLLGSAGVGGAAGGTLDVILQLMSGRKAASLRRKAGQLQTTLAKQGAEKRPEQIRADANAGLDKLRAAAPVGNISIKREVPTTGIASFSVIGEDGKVASRFSTPEAAVLAAEQYERDAGGLAKFNRPSIAEMSGQAAAVKATPALKPITRGKKRIAPVDAEAAIAPDESRETPVPEAPQTLQLQRDALQSGKRKAMLYQASDAKPSAPGGNIKRITFDDGRAIDYNPTLISEKKIRSAYKSNKLNEVLDLGPFNKEQVLASSAAGAARVSVVERTPDGTEAKAAEGTTETAPAQVAQMEQTKLAPENTVAVEPREKGLSERLAATAPASPTEAPPAAVPAPKAATPSKPFTTSIEALFKPIANTPEDVAKLADFNNRKKEIAKELNKRLSPITGKNTRVKLIDAVSFTDKAGRTQFAEGEAKGGNIIYLSYNLYDPKLTNEQLVDKLFDVMNHEVIHSLTNLGVFNPGETKTLFKAAERMKYQGNQFSYYDRAYAMYSKMPNMTEEIIREEAVAEMFRDYRSGKLKLEGTPKGLVQRAIEFFRRIFSGFRDAKVGQIFKDIESGKIGAREARPIEGGVRKFATIPQDKNTALKSLAFAQRGLPESAMLDAQMALNKYPSGPAFGKSLESIGDLTHRMSENPENNLDRGLSIVDGKVNVGLRLLSNPVDIERINAIPELPELKAYADEHAKLPVYNEAQRAARDAAIAFGRRNWAAAESTLRKLRDMIDDGSYVEVASSFDPQFEGGVRKFSILPYPDDTTSTVYIRDMVAGSRIKPSGKVKIGEIAAMFDAMTQKRDINNPEDYDNIVGSIAKEVERQMKDAQSGVGWYDEDIAIVFDELSKVFPVFNDPANSAAAKQLFTVIAGVMSNGMKARSNVVLGAANFAHFLNNGEFSPLNPFTGKGWNQRTNIMAPQIKMLNSIMKDAQFAADADETSTEKFLKWMFSPHSIPEINQMRKRHGVPSPIKGKVSDAKLGIYIFGPKFGPFILNLNGMTDETVDSWASRSFYRHMGKLLRADGTTNDAPADSDREAMKRALRDIAERTNLSSRDVQAVLWFYEKELYNSLGMKIPLEVFSDGAKEFVTKYGDPNAKQASGIDGAIARAVEGAGTRTAAEVPSRTTEADRAEVARAKSESVRIAQKAKEPNADLDSLANAANEQVRKAVRKLSVLPQTIPMPPEMEAANERIFAAKYVPSSPGEKLMAFLNGFSSKEGIMRMADMFRVYGVQKGGQITKREREAFLSGAISQEEAQFAEYSATAAQDMQARSSHYTVEVGYNGAPTIMSLNAKREQVRLSDGGDPNSAYMYVEENQKDSPFKVLEMIYEGGPNGESLIEQFRSYAIAQVSKRRIAEGKEVPSDITQEYIDGADALGEQFPIIKEAFESYQRFNTKLLEAVRDSGYLSQELFEEFTDQQNYYSMYRQLEEGDVVQGISGGLGSRIRFKAYEGSTTGNLMADPIVAMMHNVAFWNNVILRTLATQKSFRVGEATGVVKRLRAFEDEDGNVTIEEPSRDEGFDDKKFYTYVNGVEIPFASKDPLFTIGLSGNDFVSPGLMLEVAGMPANFLREMVTRDPSFMVANLLRDSVSTWVLAGSGANPYQTFKGMVSALKSSSSFNALRSHAVVGSFDEAQKPMAGIVEGMRGKLTKAQGLTSINSVLKSGWNRLGSLSEASDAATRIAVYEAAKRDGASDFTAAYRALSIMNFSRSGHHAALRTLTRLIPFLNARIQGFDVLYTGIKAAAGVVTGREQLEFERQRGTHVLVRGMGLMAATMALALLNDDDEDYKQLPQYVKDSNILIPIPGTTGKYIQIPKPFEAGFLFMTVPETFYNVATGDRSMRSATKLMFNQFSSTFGFNPIPQVALPLVENMINYDFYTGQPLVSPGLEKLDPSLQYNASTSYVARGLSEISGFLPFNYDFEEGRFAPISPVKIDNLISGYGGPLISYLAMAVGGVSYAFGEDSQGLPVAGSRLPVIRRFFVDARDRQPQAATEAYELYQIVDRVNRTISRLKKSGDTEALKEYREENINILRVGKQVRKMADNLNNIRAQMRRLEADKVMSMNEKLEKMRELRSREARVTSKIDEINQMLGR